MQYKYIQIDLHHEQVLFPLVDFRYWWCYDSLIHIYIKIAIYLSVLIW
jgi:hypothetical protein